MQLPVSRSARLNGRTHRAIPANRLIMTVRSSIIASRTFVTLFHGGVQRRIRQRPVQRVRAVAEAIVVAR
jgi:hypothetical protein